MDMMRSRYGIYIERSRWTLTIDLRQMLIGVEWSMSDVAIAIPFVELRVWF